MRRCGTMPTMLMYPQIDPVALQIGPLAVHWYGLTYLAAFGLFLCWERAGCATRPSCACRATAPGRARTWKTFFSWACSAWSSAAGWAIACSTSPATTSVPLEIFYVWQGGMSFHGGLVGVIASMVWFARSRARSWLEVADFVAPCVPTGLAAGRVGNFINGELWGRFASPELPWPWSSRKAAPCCRATPRRSTSPAGRPAAVRAAVAVCAQGAQAGPGGAVFLVGYGAFRFIAEYFREPDDFLGLLSLGMSMGQWLCVPMVIGGIAMWFWAAGRPAYPAQAGKPA